MGSSKAFKPKEVDMEDIVKEILKRDVYLMLKSIPSTIMLNIKRVKVTLKKMVQLKMLLNLSNSFKNLKLDIVSNWFIIHLPSLNGLFLVQQVNI